VCASEPCEYWAGPARHTGSANLGSTQRTDPPRRRGPALRRHDIHRAGRPRPERPARDVDIGPRPPGVRDPDGDPSRIIPPSRPPTPRARFRHNAGRDLHYVAHRGFLAVFVLLVRAEDAFTTDFDAYAVITLDVVSAGPA